MDAFRSDLWLNAKRTCLWPAGIRGTKVIDFLSLTLAQRFLKKNGTWQSRNSDEPVLELNAEHGLL